MRPSGNVQSPDLDLLLKLRLTVARFGKMDLARWWNTRGQLSSLGASALRRGFPRTHRFAQARSVFAVAAHRCNELFAPPGCVTLWRLEEEIEQAFDSRWEHWLDNAEEWNDFFNGLEKIEQLDLVEALASRDLIGTGDLESFNKLRRAAEGRAVQLPGRFEGTGQDISRNGHFASVSVANAKDAFDHSGGVGPTPLWRGHEMSVRLEGLTCVA